MFVNRVSPFGHRVTLQHRVHPGRVTPGGSVFDFRLLRLMNIYASVLIQLLIAIENEAQPVAVGTRAIIAAAHSSHVPS